MYRTVSFGQLWEEQLVSKYKETRSLKETAYFCKVNQSIARKNLNKLSTEYQMKNSKSGFSKEQIEEMIETFEQTKSVRRTSVMLGISRSSLKKYLPKELVAEVCYFYKNREEKIIAYKEKIINAISNLKAPSRTEIRQYVGSEVYKYLMKKECDWMEEHLPNKYSSKENWSDLDGEISEEIINTVYKLKNAPPIYRITKNKIKNSISSVHKSLINNNSDKLCESLKTLESCAESLEDYQIRKIPYSLNLLKKNLKKDRKNINLNDFKWLPAFREMSANVEDIIIEKLKEEGFEG